MAIQETEERDKDMIVEESGAMLRSFFAVI